MAIFWKLSIKLLIKKFFKYPKYVKFYSFFQILAEKFSKFSKKFAIIFTILLVPHFSSKVITKSQEWKKWNLLHFSQIFIQILKKVLLFLQLFLLPISQNLFFSKSDNKILKSLKCSLKILQNQVQNPKFSKNLPYYFYNYFDSNFFNSFSFNLKIAIFHISSCLQSGL